MWNACENYSKPDHNNVIMASIKMILDKRKMKSDGSYPICFLICHNRKTTTRSSKIYVLETEWDSEKKSISKIQFPTQTIECKA